MQPFFCTHTKRINNKLTQIICVVRKLFVSLLVGLCRVSDAHTLYTHSLPT